MGKSQFRGRGRGRGGGGGGRGGRGRGGGGGGNRGHDRRNDGRKPAADIPKHNKLFEKYYNELGLVDHNETEAFWTSLKTDLPNSFRFTGSRGHALTVQRRLIEHYIPEITAVQYENETVAPPTPVEWYPDKLAWSMTTPKNVIRRFPPFASFQKFLVSENNVGNITRQEIVSMIPPLVLGVKPGMAVLDMCAAPGSKSAQLIEMIHGGEEARVRKVIEQFAKKDGRELSPAGAEVEAEKEEIKTEDDWSDDGRSTGILISNDNDIRRTQMLIHQCKRLNSPNVIVTNHDAAIFPSIKLPSTTSQNTYLKFDRVLADVPCSGDGTTRKNFGIWRDWGPGNALGLHSLQTRILVRAIQMLKPGGRVVYSTCSMNPVENEAVVSAAIQRSGGPEKVEIVDQSDVLPSLKRRPGLTSWKVMDKVGRVWNDWEHIVAAKEEEGENEATSRISEEMFAPQPEIEIPLQRCMRVYAHLQDTGAFFVAVLEKQENKKPHQQNGVKVEEKEPAPITEVANEIEERNIDSKDPLAKVEALDDVAPALHDLNGETGNESAAARQNQENAPVDTPSSRKRVLDETADLLAEGESAAKRPKFRDEIFDPAPEGSEDRQVHYPPPPGAHIDLTEHASTNATGAVEATPPVPSNPTSTSIPPIPKRKPGQPHEEPYKYLDPTHPELTHISKFYHLHPRFPMDRFMVRNSMGSPVKGIYYTSALARDVLTENEGAGIKFLHAGVKMFVKQDVQGREDACAWRIQSEGLPIIDGWVGAQRVVRCWRRGTLRKLLVNMFPRVANGAWKDLGEVGEAMKDMSMGCCVLRVEPKPQSGADIDTTITEDDDGDEDEGFTERLVLPLWRGISSLNLMLPKEDRKAMLLRLFNDDAELINESYGGSHAKDDNQNHGRNGDSNIDNVSGDPDLAANEASVNESKINGDQSDEDDEEDGGVLLGQGEVASAAVEERVLEAEDAMAGEVENETMQTREVAPGVADEDDRFNRTV